MNIDKSLRAENLHSRQGTTIKGIVLHDTAGSGGPGDARYLADDPEKRGISVDFCIVKDGTIYQLNPDLEKLYSIHAGRKTNWPTKKLKGPMVNKSTLGIEIAQKAKIELLPDPKYPPIQVQAVAFVCAELCKKFKLTKLDITTHKDLITDMSRSDPRQFPWPDFWALFNKYLAEGGPETKPTDVANQRVYHTVVKGDTLWALAVKYNTKIEVLKGLNNMDTPSNLIEEGRVMLVKE